MEYNSSIKRLNEWLSCKHLETNRSYGNIIYNLLDSVVQIMHKKNTDIKDLNDLRIHVSTHIYDEWSKYPEHIH